MLFRIVSAHFTLRLRVLFNNKKKITYIFLFTFLIIISLHISECNYTRFQLRLTIDHENLKQSGTICASMCK